MSKMMKFLNRTNASLPFGNHGNRNNIPRDSGVDVSGSGPAVPARPDSNPRPIPTPLQLNGQMNGHGDGYGSSNNVRGSEVYNGNHTPDSRPSSTISRRMSDVASQFPFYHGYLSEDQEEDVFMDHLNETGSYIMRDSKSNSRAITMSVVIDPLHLYHFQVVQRDHTYRVIGKGKDFPTLNAMIEYYQLNNIPGKTDEPVFLSFPVITARRGRLPATPTSPAAPASPFRERPHENGRTTPVVKTVQSPPWGQTLPIRPPASPHRDPTTGATIQRQGSLPPIEEPASAAGGSPDPFYENENAENEEALQTYSTADVAEVRPAPSTDDVDADLGGGACAPSGEDITFRPPMPIPRQESDYEHRSHIYSVPDQPDLDRIKTVMELCRQSDVIHASRKKCTCGLYLEESTLTKDWMMHIDNEPGKTQGRLFFLDTKTNKTSWTLPDDIAEELKIKYPVKWEFVQKQLAATRKNSGT